MQLKLIYQNKVMYTFRLKRWLLKDQPYLQISSSFISFWLVKTEQGGEVVARHVALNFEYTIS